MSVSKLHRKNQSSVVRAAVVAALLFIVYALNEERTRLAHSVVASSATVSTESADTGTVASTENSGLSEISQSVQTSGSAAAFGSIENSSERSTPISGHIYPVQDLAAQVRAFDTAPVGAADAPCVPYIFYDKPVKTGSTAASEAMAQYLKTVGEPEGVCLTLEACTDLATTTCNGQRERIHLIQHVSITSPVTACLRNKGYYHATSIREPKERIISAWKYSMRKKTSHYGIPWNASFEEFLERFPRCAMYRYYDGKLGQCGSEEDVIARAKEIVSRMDEIIDLYQEPITDLHRRIYPFLSQVNVATSGRSQSSELHVPDEIVKSEYILYNMMQERRLSLAQKPRRRLCPKPQR